LKGDGSIPLRESAKLTFVQLTDAHLFDEGKKQSSEDAFRQAAGDRAALRWAIEQVNPRRRGQTERFCCLYRRPGAGKR
jgi:hypothetical protein